MRRALLRPVFPRIVAALAASALLACSVLAQASVRSVESVGLTVSDLDRSVAFFRDVLSFELVAEDEHQGAAHEDLEGVFGLHTREKSF